MNLTPFVSVRSNAATCIVLTSFLFVFQIAFCEIIPQDRRITWSAGVEGGIPVVTTIFETLPLSATLTRINEAIAACPQNQVVKLSEGTYDLNGTINFYGKKNVVLRGAGPGSTILNRTNIYVQASSITPSWWIAGVLDNAGRTKNWIAGFAQGATQITLDSVSGLSVGQVVGLDQLEDGNEVKTRDCGYCSRPGITTNDGLRSQAQYVKITNINGNILTISPGLYMPNWSANRSPQVYWAWAGTSEKVGIEDLYIDHSGVGGQYGIDFVGTWNCWVKNVTSNLANQAHIHNQFGGRTEVRHCIVKDTQNAQSQSYGILWTYSSANLVEDNIARGCAGAVMMGAQASGSVTAYNFTYDNRYNAAPGWMILTLTNHAGHNSMNLFEGNWANGANLDFLHGSGSRNTYLRNRLEGSEFAPVEKGGNTNAVTIEANNRYENFVGNLLGTVGFTDKYSNSGVTTAAECQTYRNRSVYVVGWADCVASSYDSLSLSTLLRHGNYDVVNQGQVWEPSITDHTIPNSYLYTSKPAWFGNLPWPPYSPANFGGATRTSIPAGYRYVNGVDPGVGPTPTPAPGGTPTPTPGATPRPPEGLRVVP